MCCLIHRWAAGAGRSWCAGCVLVLADVHGDLAALDAAITDAGPVDGIWFLGDAIDFGPEPDGTVARLRAIGAPWVVGNHDADAAAGRPGDGWSGGALGDGERAFLGGLPAQLVLGGATLRHSLAPDLSLRAPEPADFAGFDTAVCLVGHTHMPFLYLDGPEGELRWVEPRDGQPVESRRPPRDRQPRLDRVVIRRPEPVVLPHLRVRRALGAAHVARLAPARRGGGERMRARGAVALAEMQLVYAQGRPRRCSIRRRSTAPGRPRGVTPEDHRVLAARLRQPHAVRSWTSAATAQRAASFSDA